MDKPCKATGSIRNWPREDRPREKLLRDGEHTLTNSELLAVLLRTGIKGRSAIDLARNILEKFRTFRAVSRADTFRWREFKGLGDAKIAQIKAAFEIGKRFAEEEAKEKRPKLGSSKDVAEILMARMRDLPRETFRTIMLDSRARIINIAQITEGTVDEAIPAIREIYQKALQNYAVSIICAHNHPAGDPAPSGEDKAFTKELCRAGEVMGIPVLDHVIIGDNKYFSFADERLIL